MIVLDDKIISNEIKEICFACDLRKCKGACCVDGDAGAPLEEAEISILEDDIEYIKPFMTEAGRREVEKNGVFDYDADGKFVTPLVDGGACAFVNFDEEGIAFCTIEQAFLDNKTDFQKPLSCHLYPIRISQLRDGGEALNYHKWHICKPALKRGSREKYALKKFVKTALIRKYGNGWYERFLKILEDDLIKK
ncbi:MAG: DUF3109 family protein [Bacteroidales bacterium]|nr:DUF3109 family protein [Bacteroidales bacterium]MCF8386653.1 DUF3109 family protein [Bacteroidales bacterium]MCF8399299.1 DUF3109 family protein [Bacteroidales bacterium]